MLKQPLTFFYILSDHNHVFRRHTVDYSTSSSAMEQCFLANKQYVNSFTACKKTSAQKNMVPLYIFLTLNILCVKSSLLCTNPHLHIKAHNLLYWLGWILQHRHCVTLFFNHHFRNAVKSVAGISFNSSLTWELIYSVYFSCCGAAIVTFIIDYSANYFLD